MPSFSRFWSGTLLPLALALPLLIHAAWEQRVGLPMDQREAVVWQYGFPLPASMEHCCISATPEIFATPLLLNWACALLWVTALGYRLWPRWQKRHLKRLTALIWLIAGPTVLLHLVPFGMARWSWVSPYPVVQTLSVHPRFGFW